MARDGMADLIQIVRRRTNAGTADHEVGGETYWSDDHIQEVLDTHRTTHRRVPIYADPEYVDGEWRYYEYPIPAKYIERDAAGSGFALRTNRGVAVDDSEYSINYEAQVITFDSDQESEWYYLDYRAYDIHMAAADIWESKASFYEDMVDWSTDNHRVNQAQQAEHARKMARKERSLAGPNFARRVRVDEAARGGKRWW